MRPRFEKSLCKCSRCVAKRRVRFFTLASVCIGMGAGCYILLGHSKSVAPHFSLSLREAPSEAYASGADAMTRGDWESVSRSSAHPATRWKQKGTEVAPKDLTADGSSTGSLEPAKNLTFTDRCRSPVDLHSTDPIGEAPMPRTSGWQTVPLDDAGGGSTAGVRSTTRPADPKGDMPETAKTGKEGSSEAVSIVEAAESDKPVPSQPKRTEMASQSKPGEGSVARGNADSVPVLENEPKAPDAKPAETSRPLLTSLESNPVKHGPVEERRGPRGAIEAESEAPRNPVTADHPPKTDDHPLRAQALYGKVQDRPLAAQNDFRKPRDHLSKPEKKSGDLQRFASAFFQADQSDNIANQHRFYADSVHFYREGDLSWAGVAAATRRYHQERQNTQYGIAGTAAVKGPVNGGFYVVEQPVSWSRSGGSRITRGRSVLRIRVVPTNRGDWKITSIEEIKQ